MSIGDRLNQRFMQKAGSTMESQRALTFPPGFLWGTATASHQVEGNNTNNQWWSFEQKPGAIWYGDRSSAACNWWCNAEGDFDRMASMGLNSHRLSVEWSRIEPDPGQFDHKTLDRYREILASLRSRGIAPMVTLHHFTEPLWFTRIGGWENGASVAFFRRFVEQTVKALRDLCDFWATINEPNVYMAQGWFLAVWPPQKSDFLKAMSVMRNMLNAHAEAYHTIHEIQPDAKVGYAHHVRLFRGLNPHSRLDRYAAGLKRWLFEHIWVAATKDGRLRPPLAPLQKNHRLANTYDYIGINYYTRDRVRFTPNPLKLFGEELYEPEGELSDAGRHGAFSQFQPDGLYQVCHEVNRFDPGVPIYITENGVPDREDRLRPRWLLAHLHQLQRAIQEGCNVKGYYHWTLVDNFEWAEGWGLRFGLYALDPKTQERTPRLSAELYREIVQHNGITRQMMEKYGGDYYGI
jgi:beta-glucosidase